MTSISLDRVSRKFGSVVALNEISIDIPDGEFLVLLGPSGCGKSTLLRILAGLLPATSGRVIIDNEDVTALPPAERDIAMVFQSYALYPHLTVEKNLGFGLRVRKHSKEEVTGKVAKVAEQLKLTALLERKPKELSGGQRQRVALGRAVVRDPRAFLMDEPLSNLDAQLRTATRLEIAALHHRLKTTFVYVTHDQVEAMTMATRIAIMNNGNLEQIGTPAEVYDEPASTFVASFIGAPPMNLIPAEIRSINGRVHVQATGFDVEIANGTMDARPVLVGVRPEHLSIASSPASCQFAATVAAVENLGSEEVAFCDVGETQIAVRGARPINLEEGQKVTLYASATNLYFFDPTTTRRLVWVDDEAVDREASALFDNDESASHRHRRSASSVQTLIH